MTDNKEMYKRRSFQNDVKMNSQVSRVRHGFLSLKGLWVQTTLEPVSFHAAPGLTLHGQYQDSCTIMVDRHGRPPNSRICFAINPAKRQDMGGPFCPHYADLESLSSASLLDVGIPWTQKLERHKDANRLLSPFPAFLLFRKCIVTNSVTKGSKDDHKWIFCCFCWQNKQTNKQTPTRTQQPLVKFTFA